MKLADIARVIRSKNASPTTLTLDLLFNDEDGFNAYHVMEVDALEPLFPVEIEAL